MRITSIEAYTYELGYRYGTYVMSGGRIVKTLTSTVVRIVDFCSVVKLTEVADCFVAAAPWPVVAAPDLLS